MAPQKQLNRARGSRYRTDIRLVNGRATEETKGPVILPLLTALNVCRHGMITLMP